MIDSWTERKLKNIRPLKPGEIRQIFAWLREQDRKIMGYERMIEDREKPVRGLRKMPAVMG